MRKLPSTGLVGGFSQRHRSRSASDPLEDVRRFSDFAAADLRHVLDGDILGTRGSLMNFPNGLSAQTCFVTPEAAAETARRLLIWDPLPHDALNVFAYQAMRGPCETADFQSLNLKSNQGAIRWLLDKTLATTADNKPLPFADNSVDEVIADYLMEHIVNLVPLMEELYRVCEKDAKIVFKVPYFKSTAAFKDPTHVRFFTERTFEYFDKRYTEDHRLPEYQLKCDFRVEKITYNYYTLAQNICHSSAYCGASCGMS